MNKNTRGILCTLLGGAFWGFSGACGEYLFTNYQVASAWLTTVRMLGAGVVLTTFSLLTKRGRALDIWKVRVDAAQLVIFALLGLAFSQYTYLASIDHSNAGTATVLQYLSPVMIMAVLCVMERKKPRVSELIALVLAVAGVFLLATHGDFSNLAATGKAVAVGILSAVT